MARPPLPEPYIQPAYDRPLPIRWPWLPAFTQCDDEAVLERWRASEHETWVDDDDNT